MNTFNPDDPKYTAYILGELSDEQAAELEAEFARNPEAKAYAEELRKTAERVRDNFNNEPNIQLIPLQKARVISHLPKRGTKGRRPSGAVLALAATIVILLGASIFVPAVTSSLQSAESLRNQLVGATEERGGDVPVAYDVAYTGAEGISAGLRYFDFDSTQPPAPPVISPSQDDFAPVEPNTFQRVADHPLSTFSIDVDTASYAVVRKFLNEGRLPPRDAVRVEELINYFNYDYAPPADGAAFAAHMDIAPCPWKPEHHLVRIGIKGREIPAEERPALNLVYLLDVSGSMNQANKLPLVKRSLQALVQQLDERDRVAIVVYAGAAGLVLPTTSGADSRAILEAIDRLSAGGSTAGGAGIQLAYQTARDQFVEDGVNRVILCTDGDFNVGLNQRGDLERLIEEEAKSGVQLTVLGFGMGNYKDANLEGLSNKGNGNYGYIDDFNEARKLLVDQMLGTLVTIAKDVKIQVEFNPAHIAAYRLIGYENRMLKKEDFNNDKVDAGDIGAGHTVTALYELVPAGRPVPGEPPAVDDLKYQTRPDTGDASAELLTLKLRHKQPGGDTSTKQEFALPMSALEEGEADADYRFATAVAAFGLWLRDPEFREDMSLDAILERAEAAKGEDRFGYRAEFLRLVRNAMALQ